MLQYRDHYRAPIIDRKSGLPPLQFARLEHFIPLPTQSQSQPRIAHNPLNRLTNHHNRICHSLRPRPRNINLQQYP